jgi:glycosyltransferase involved in cell wall biosynthesis
LPKEDLIWVHSHAVLFICPSIYEPFVIISLEAMACGTPVLALAVGSIREVVDHEKTGLLVPFEPKSTNNSEPKDPGAKGGIEARQTLPYVIWHSDTVLTLPAAHHAPW